MAERAVVNRARPSNRLIELPVVRFKSKAVKPGAPVVYLAGGPGGAATREAFLARELFAQLQQTRDIVLMDQRGTGQAKPGTGWLAPTALPTDFFSSEQRALAIIRERHQQSLAAFQQRGLDLLAYNSNESADDLNDLRQALGAEKLALIGFSYGTHLALATIRRQAAAKIRIDFPGVISLFCV